MDIELPLNFDMIILETWREGNWREVEEYKILNFLLPEQEIKTHIINLINQDKSQYAYYLEKWC